MKKLIELDAALEGLENLNVISFYEANEHSKEAYIETKDMLKALSTVDAVLREIEQANKQAAYVRGYEDGQKDKYSRWMDAVPMVHGKWINGKCDKCGGHAPFWAMATTYYHSKFCPHCGAKMDGNNHE